MKREDMLRKKDISHDVASRPRWFCAECGAKFNRRVNFCSECGAKIVDIPDAGNAADQASTSGDVLRFEIGKGAALELVKVSPGEFTMGDKDIPNAPEHLVRIPCDYYIGKSAVTQLQYQTVMGGNPSYFQNGDNPVEKVSYNDAMRLMAKLNHKLARCIPSGYKFDLPTEAQWEFAARGGTKSRGFRYSGSNAPEEVSWSSDNSSSRTHRCCTLLANELGIYDMSGNVWEWCQDLWGGGEEDAAPDPFGPVSGVNRVLRGGSWNFGPEYSQVAYRNNSSPDNRHFCIGFRVALISIR